MPKEAKDKKQENMLLTLYVARIIEARTPYMNDFPMTISRSPEEDQINTFTLACRWETPIQVRLLKQVLT